MAEITTTRQTLRVNGITKTVVAPIAENPDTGQAERYYKFFDAAGEPVLTVLVAGAEPADIEVTIPEHSF